MPPQPSLRRTRMPFVIRANNLEMAIGYEVRIYRKKLGLSVTDLAGADWHVGRHAFENRER